MLDLRRRPVWQRVLFGARKLRAWLKLALGPKVRHGELLVANGHRTGRPLRDDGGCATTCGDHDWHPASPKDVGTDQVVGLELSFRLAHVKRSERDEMLDVEDLAAPHDHNLDGALW